MSNSVFTYDNITVNSPNTQYTDDAIVSRYEYTTVQVENGVATPVTETFESEPRPPSPSWASCWSAGAATTAAP
jgi:hypothetical protein